MGKRNSMEVFKGRKLIGKGRKKKFSKKIIKDKQSQADIDFVRYIGKLSNFDNHDTGV